MSVFDSSPVVPLTQENPVITQIPTPKPLGDSPVLSHYGRLSALMTCPETVYVDLSRPKLIINGHEEVFLDTTQLHHHLVGYAGVWDIGLVVSEMRPQQVQLVQAQASERVYAYKSTTMELIELDGEDDGQKVPCEVGKTVVNSPEREAIQAHHRETWLSAQEKVTALQDKLKELNDRDAALKSKLAQANIRFDCTGEKVKHDNVYRVLRNDVFVGTLRRSYVSETRKPWVFIGTDEGPYFGEKTPFDDFEQAYKGVAEVIAGYDAIVPAAPSDGQKVPCEVGKTVVNSPKVTQW